MPSKINNSYKRKESERRRNDRLQDNYLPRKYDSYMRQLREKHKSNSNSRTRAVKIDKDRFSEKERTFGKSENIRYSEVEHEEKPIISVNIQNEKEMF